MVGEDVAAGVRAATPVVKRTGGRVGDWLATVGWGKFFLLSILLLIFGGIAGNVFFEHGPTVVIDRDIAREPVNVTVSVSGKGVTIGPTAPGQSKKSTGREAPGAGIRIDEKGVRILAEKDGRKVVVAIDDKGVRIQDSAFGEGVEPAIVIPPEAAEDPEKMEEALEAARDKIEEIVGEQVSRQVARRTRVYQEQSSDWLMLFILLVIVSAVIVKVVLGSKKKAESRAQAATVTAAEEGLKRQLAEAQLKMMQAQVEPHFLFNTLASVDFLIETDPPRASKMQKNLIQYLRAALPQMREGSTTLGKEVALCRSYLEILKVRMDDRLQFALNVPQGLASAQFPPMMMQSLVENAVKHGLEPKAEGGALTISADVANGRLRVTVADTGLGFGTGAKPGTSVGLANVRDRLGALYGGLACLQVESNTPNGTIATIEVPYSIEVADPHTSFDSNAGPAAQAA